MDLSTLGSLISSVGFPVVACIALGFFIYRAFQAIMDRSERREEKLYEFLGKAEKINEDLTETNSKFVEVLRNYRRDLDEIKYDINEIKKNIQSKGE